MRVTVLYNEYNESLREGTRPEALQEILAAVKECGYEATTLVANQALGVNLSISTYKDLVLNLAPGAGGDASYIYAPSTMAYQQIPFTGPDALSCGLVQSKVSTHQILSSVGIPTPATQVVESLEDLQAAVKVIKFPMILKPAFYSHGAGTFEFSYCEDEEDLMSTFLAYREQGLGYFMAQQFIPGREFSLFVLGDSHSFRPIFTVQVEPAAAGFKILSTEARDAALSSAEVMEKLYTSKVYLTPQEAKLVSQISVSAAAVLGCFDWARIDLKVTPDHIPYVLDVKCLPELTASDDPRVALMFKSIGLTPKKLVQSILESAIARQGLDKSRVDNSSPEVSDGVKSDGVAA